MKLQIVSRGVRTMVSSGELDSFAIELPNEPKSKSLISETFIGTKLQ